MTKESNKHILVGRGDNSYRHEFENKWEVLSFLYGILSDLDKYFSSETESENEDYLYRFDIEDDQIEYIRPDGKSFYASGWHWSEPQTLLLPDGESFYTKVDKIN